MAITRRTFLMALGIAPAMMTSKESVADAVIPKFKGKGGVPYPYYYAGGVMKEGRVIKNYLCSPNLPPLEVKADAMGLAGQLNQVLDQVVFGGSVGGGMTNLVKKSLTLAEFDQAVRKFWTAQPRSFEESATFSVEQWQHLKQKMVDQHWRRMISRISTPIQPSKSFYERFRPDLATLPPQEHQKEQETPFPRYLGMEKQS